MSRAKLRVCSVPGCGLMQRGALCRPHKIIEDQKQRRTVPTKVTEPRDRARRRAAVSAHRERHGDWCPGFGRAAHRSADLTADHRREIQEGGSPSGALDVLCRSCNSRKAKRTQDRRRASNGRSMRSGVGVRPPGGYPSAGGGAVAAGEG
ncbi:hypothetical protein [Gordonia sputi]